MKKKKRKEEEGYLELYGSGSNSNGQLGTGERKDLNQFTLIKRWDDPLTQFISFTSAARHSIFLIQESKKNQFPSLMVSGDFHLIHHHPPEVQFKKIKFKTLVSSIQSIHPELLNKLIKSYQPTIVGSAWETTFINLDSFQDHQSRHQDSSVLISLGSNDFGLRGTQDGLISRIEDPSLVEFNLPFQSTFKIKKLVGGPKHILALISIRSDQSDKSSVEIVGWGAARHGQLGHSSDSNQKPFKSSSPKRLNLPFDLPRDPNLIQIGVGKEHTVIVCPDQMISLGHPNHSQIPNLTSNDDQILSVQCCWNTTFFLKQPITQTSPPASYSLLGFGNNSQAQLGYLDPNLSTSETHFNGSTGQMKLAVGSEHVLVTDQDDLLYGWGWNEHGNLGPSSLSSNHSNLIKSREVIWRASKDQKLLKIFAGCATSFLLIQTSSSS
ncbi:regulator of chromosome condensation 1/beta-lactamase-inhibitor protein II [Melampsora americana]|nr:regulator of chromosome condensation 1/beta-lactamase-inhibitor protein II [Melampsora americana]